MSSQPLAADQAAPQITPAGGFSLASRKIFFHEPRIEATLDARLTSIGPSMSHELPMPAQQRRWRHHNRPPALSRQQPGQRGLDQAITCTLQGALATGCDLEVSWLVKDYEFVRMNPRLGALYEANLEEVIAL
jgi:hypothetical protein